MKPVLVHPLATREAIEAFDWYAERSEQAPHRFEQALDRAIERIRANPRVFMRIRGETRRELLTNFPYAVIFRETELNILILAIAHTSRRPGYWRKRSF